MWGERLFARLGLVASDSATSAPIQATSQDLPLITESRLNPYEVVKNNKALRGEIFRSLDPRDAIAGGLIALPDQPTNGLYVCKKNDKNNASFWLNPLIWSAALREFADFINKAGGKEVKLHVKYHEASTAGYGHSEWAGISPVILRGNGPSVGSNALFGLTNEGKVSFSSRSVRNFDLGYLNPGRLKQEFLESVSPR